MKIFIPVFMSNIIWSRHYLDGSTAFLSGQCVYIWVKVEYHKNIKFFIVDIKQKSGKNT